MNLKFEIEHSKFKTSYRLPEASKLGVRHIHHILACPTFPFPYWSMTDCSVCTTMEGSVPHACKQPSSQVSHGIINILQEGQKESTMAMCTLVTNMMEAQWANEAAQQQQNWTFMANIIAAMNPSHAQPKPFVPTAFQGFSSHALVNQALLFQDFGFIPLIRWHSQVILKHKLPSHKPITQPSSLFCCKHSRAHVP